MRADEQVRASVIARLESAGCVAAEREATELLEAAPDPATLDAWLGRREQGEPPAWILGATRFGGLDLRVDAGVYVPRPQSEELANRAVERLAPGARVIDLCTGSGAVAAVVQAAVAGAVVVGVDVDPAAVACARSNGVVAVVGDLDGPIGRRGWFDLVTCVAPYVPTAHLDLLPVDVTRHEPSRALDGGPDGLRLVRRAVIAATRLLRPSGWLLVEIGGDQDQALAPLLVAAGFDVIEPWWDDDGDLRGLGARLSACATEATGPAGHGASGGGGATAGSGAP